MLENTSGSMAEGLLGGLLGLGFLWLLGGVVEGLAVAASERRQLAPPAGPEALALPVGPSLEEQKEKTLQARLHTLRAQYNDFSHYSDFTWLHKYAKDHMAWLLANRDDILTESRKLHEQRIDPAYDEDLAYIYDQDQELYERMTWQTRVLSIAERLALEKHEPDAETIRAGHGQRMAELVVEYHDFDHYQQAEWIERYASHPQHQKELLAQRHTIIAAAVALHEDPDFIDALKACAPGIYARAMWRLKALAIADRLAVEPRHLSPEEREEKIIRFRQRMLDRLSVKAEDQIALKLQRFEFAQQLRERAERLGLDDDAIDRLEQELLGELDHDDEDKSNGYRRL